MVWYTLFMKKILVSACLVGEIVRYDKKQTKFDHILFKEWEAGGQLIPFCPEVAGGLATPRDPAEIVNGDGRDVLVQKAWLRTSKGEDVTQPFLRGAAKALDLVNAHSIKIAILKAKSPSCGSAYIYDGTFEKRLIQGVGVTTAVLRKNGVMIFSEFELERAKSFLKHKF
jgi:uncharacterized protein YbbK (DUF523 family)